MSGPPSDLFKEMEILRDKNKSICRACRKDLDTDVPVPLAKKEGSKTLGEIMEMMSGLKFTSSVGLDISLALPKNVCVECTGNIKSFYKTRNLLIESAKSFSKEYIDIRLKSAGTSVDADLQKSIKEEIKRILGEVAIPDEVKIKQEKPDLASNSLVSRSSTTSLPSSLTPNLVSSRPNTSTSSLPSTVASPPANTSTSSLPPTLVSPRSTSSNNSNIVPPVPLFDSNQSNLPPSASPTVSTLPRTVSPIIIRRTTTVNPPASNLVTNENSRPTLPVVNGHNSNIDKECGFCLRRYPCTEQLIRHIAVVHRKKTYPCKICDKKCFSQLHYLANHYRRKHLDNQDVLIKKAVLQVSHVQVTNGHAPTQKRKRRISSSSNSGSNKVIRTNNSSAIVSDSSDTNEKETESESEESGEEVDAETKPFKCKYCPKRCTLKGPLIRHMNAMHPENLSSSTAKLTSINKRSWNLLTKEQYEKLESEFVKLNHYANVEQVKELANELKVSEDKVRNWFVNRRRKHERDATKNVNSN